MLAKVTLFMNTETEELMNEADALELAEETERENYPIEDFIDDKYRASDLYAMANDFVNVQGFENGGEVFDFLEKEYDEHIKSAVFDQVYNSSFWKKYTVPVDCDNIQVKSE